MGRGAPLQAEAYLSRAESRVPGTMAITWAVLACGHALVGICERLTEIRDLLAEAPDGR
jgi:hypothetical protein